MKTTLTALALTAALFAGQAIAGPKGVHELQLKTLEVRGQGRAQLRVVVNQQYAVHEQFSHRQALSPRGSSTEAPAAHNAR